MIVKAPKRYWVIMTNYIVENNNGECKKITEPILIYKDKDKKRAYEKIEELKSQPDNQNGYWAWSTQLGNE